MSTFGCKVKRMRTGRSDGKKLRLLVLRPKRRDPEKKPPLILWIHGGGYAVGMAGMVFFSRAIHLVKKFGAVVVAPSYRLSGKWPYPAALEDCYTALTYVKENAAALGGDENRLMVGGESAGGGLTAALCMLARDRGEVRVAFQMPLYPMLDDRPTESSRDNHAPVWNTRRNKAAWKQYLRSLEEGEIPPYAAPARQNDYAGLPPAYTFVGDVEPFYCETLTYIENLQKAGVAARVDVYPGCFHAFDMLTPWRKVSKQAAKAFEEAYVQAAEKCCKP
ncbi:MAG: alpha/beta hydrolase [Christensenellaceae bacterium]|nr:alpha/beta hydrolase [Christensenellaceae bacterium]